MAYNLQIVSKDLEINCNVKYEKMDTTKKQEVKAFAPDGTEVKQRNCYEGKPVTCQRVWMDDNGKQYSKQELTFKMDDEVVSNVSQTKVFDALKCISAEDYNNKYVVDKYYELYPSDNGMKKDIDREYAVKGNQYQMYKLWKHLIDSNQIMIAPFASSSLGFYEDIGYIRAVDIEGKWGLELGVIRENKAFSHLQEGTPIQQEATQQKQAQRKTRVQI
jgi:hypothetical protein